jgi:hypothetical protein
MLTISVDSTTAILQNHIGIHSDDKCFGSGHVQCYSWSLNRQNEGTRTAIAIIFGINERSNDDHHIVGYLVSIRMGPCTCKCNGNNSKYISKNSYFLHRISPIGVFFLVAAKILEIGSFEEIVGQLGWYFVTVMIGLGLHGFGEWERISFCNSWLN